MKKDRKTASRVDISLEDFCFLVAKEAQYKSSSVASVKRYMRAIYKVILKQLQLNGRVNIKGFGIFEVRDRKSGERFIKDPVTGEERLVYVAPRKAVTFRASDCFDTSINEGDYRIVENATRYKKNKKQEKYLNDSMIELLNKVKEKGAKKDETKV